MYEIAICNICIYINLKWVGTDISIVNYPLISFPCLFPCELPLQPWETWLSPLAVHLIGALQYAYVAMSELLTHTPEGNDFSD